MIYILLLVGIASHQQFNNSLQSTYICTPPPHVTAGTVHFHQSLSPFVKMYLTVMPFTCHSTKELKQALK